MSIKLKDALFEMTNNEVHSIFENKKEIPIEDNIQTLSKATLEMVSKFIAQKIQGAVPEPEKIPEETLEEPLGIITFQMLKKLSTVAIKGLKANPAQVKGEQQQGITPLDFSKYESQQVVPMFLTNKELENIGGEKSGNEFAAIFYIPALFSPIIGNKNKALHKAFFGLEEPEKGNVSMHTSISRLHYEMIEPDEMKNIQKDFMTGMPTSMLKTNKKQPARKITGSSKAVGASKVKQDGQSNNADNADNMEDADYSLKNVNKLYENSLVSLLFEGDEDDEDVEGVEVDSIVDELANVEQKQTTVGTSAEISAHTFQNIGTAKEEAEDQIEQSDQELQKPLENVDAFNDVLKQKKVMLFTTNKKPFAVFHILTPNQPTNGEIIVFEYKPRKINNFEYTDRTLAMVMSAIDKHPYKVINEPNDVRSLISDINKHNPEASTIDKEVVIKSLREKFNLDSDDPGDEPVDEPVDEPSEESSDVKRTEMKKLESFLREKTSFKMFWQEEDTFYFYLFGEKWLEILNNKNLKVLRGPPLNSKLVKLIGDSPVPGDTFTAKTDAELLKEEYFTNTDIQLIRKNALLLNEKEFIVKHIAFLKDVKPEEERRTSKKKVTEQQAERVINRIEKYFGSKKSFIKCLSKQWYKDVNNKKVNLAKMSDNDLTAFLASIPDLTTSLDTILKSTSNSNFLNMAKNRIPIILKNQKFLNRVIKSADMPDAIPQIHRRTNKKIKQLIDVVKKDSNNNEINRFIGKLVFDQWLKNKNIAAESFIHKTYSLEHLLYENSLNENSLNEILGRSGINTQMTNHYLNAVINYLATGKGPIKLSADETGAEAGDERSEDEAGDERSEDESSEHFKLWMLRDAAKAAKVTYDVANQVTKGKKELPDNLQKGIDSLELEKNMSEDNEEKSIKILKLEVELLDQAQKSFNEIKIASDAICDDNEVWTDTAHYDTALERVKELANKIKSAMDVVDTENIDISNILDFKFNNDARSGQVDHRLWKDNLKDSINNVADSIDKFVASKTKDLDEVIRLFGVKVKKEADVIEEKAFKFREELKYNIDTLYKPFSKLSNIDITYEDFESYFDDFAKQAQERVDAALEDHDAKILHEPLELRLKPLLSMANKIKIDDAAVRDLVTILARNFIDLPYEKRKELTGVETRTYFIESFYEALDIKEGAGRFNESKRIKGKQQLNEIVGYGAGLGVGLVILLNAPFTIPIIATSALAGALTGYGIGQVFNIDDGLKRTLSKKLAKKEDVVKAIMSKIDDKGSIAYQYKELLSLSIVNTLREYFIGLEGQLKDKYNIVVKPVNQKEYRRIKTKQKEQAKSAKKLEGMSDFGKELMTKIEDIGHEMLPSMPGSNHFSDITITRVNTALKESKYINQIIDHLQEDAAGRSDESYVFKKGIKQLLLEEDDATTESVAKKKALNIPMNKMFGELKRLVAQSLYKTNYNESIIKDVEKDLIKHVKQNRSTMNKIGKDESKTVPIDLVVRTLSKYTGIPQAKIKKQLFESKTANLNLINYNNKKHVEKVLNERILGGSLSNLLFEKTNTASAKASSDWHSWSPDGRHYFEEVKAVDTTSMPKYYHTDFGKSVNRSLIKDDSLTPSEYVPGHIGQHGGDGAYIKWDLKVGGKTVEVEIQTKEFQIDYKHNFDAIADTASKNNMGFSNEDISSLKVSSSIDPSTGELILTHSKHGKVYSGELNSLKLPSLDRTIELEDVDAYQAKIASTKSEIGGTFGSVELADIPVESKVDAYLTYKLGAVRGDYIIYKGLAIPKTHSSWTDGTVDYSELNFDNDVIEGVKTFDSSGRIIEIKIAKGVAKDSIQTIPLSNGDRIGTMKDIMSARDRLVGKPVKSTTLKGDEIGDHPKAVGPNETPTDIAKKTLLSDSEERSEDDDELGSGGDEPAEEPKAVEPKEEPAEEPKAVEPKEEPAEEPKAVKPKEEPADEPKADEPKAVEPKAVEPKAVEPKAVEPLNSSVDSGHKYTAEEVQSIKSSPEIDFDEQMALVNAERWVDVDGKIINSEHADFDTAINNEASALNDILKEKSKDSAIGDYYKVEAVGDKFRLSYHTSDNKEILSFDFEGSDVGRDWLIDFYNSAGIAESARMKLQGVELKSYEHWLAEKSIADDVAAGAADDVAAGLTDKFSEGLSYILPVIPVVLYGYRTFKSISAAKNSVVLKDVMDSIKTESDLGFFNISATVPLAYRICKLLEENQSELKKYNINITGPLGEEKAGTTGMGSQNLASSQLVSSIKSNLKKNTGGLFKKWRGQSKAAAVNIDNITDDQIADAIKDSLTTICIGITKMYDKERYDTAIKVADKETFTKEASKWFASKDYDNIINRIGGKAVSKERENSLNQNVSKDVELLTDFIIGLNKSSKGISENFYLNKLSSLLFETNRLFEADKKTIINVKELQKGLKAKGVLIYGAGLKPDSEDFVKGENYLVGTIADFLYTNFDIEVQGVEEYKKQNLTTIAVEAAVDKDAAAGEAASKELEKVVEGSGVPTDMNAAFDMNQLASLMNMCGGNPMFAFIMMMIQNPQLMQQLMNLNQKGGTLGDGVDIIASESEELSGIEKQIEVAIEEKRKGLESISSKEVKRLYKVLDNDPLQIIKNIKGDYRQIKPGDDQMFIATIKQHFNIVKEIMTYGEDEVKALASFIRYRYYNIDKASKIDEESAQGSPRLLTAAVYYIAEKVLKTSLRKYELFAKSELDEIQKNPDHEFSTYHSESNKVNIFSLVKKEFEEQYSALQGISSLQQESRRRRKSVLSKKKKTLTVISEAKFLEQEYKRLWNLR